MLAMLLTVSAQAQTPAPVASEVSGKTIEIQYPFGTMAIYLRPDGMSLAALIWGGRPPEVMGLNRWSSQDGALCFSPLDKGVPADWGCAKIAIGKDSAINLSFIADDPLKGKLLSENPHDLRSGREAIMGISGQTIVVSDRDTSRMLKLYLSADGVAHANIADFGSPQPDIRLGKWSLQNDLLCLTGFGETATLKDGCVPIATMQDGNAYLGGSIRMSGKVWPGNSEGL
ncbi:hypothetical protein BA190_07865 [Labrys sp. WJW]|uniref:hypothetical protein n=1 Tax=Labrys sp. WJW TaxID=1737983 RepID=UPI00083190CA|nr:hypothetical protein [Labrys sp. WJW]OCC05346.1 hypothetical protein BA190_07865 [Labrys sp. WJW]